MNKKIARALFGAAILILLGPAQGFAQYSVSKYKNQHEDYDGQLRFGRVMVVPGLSFDTVYDSNVFKEADFTFVNGSEGRSDDFIFITSPSIHTFLKREAGDPFGFEFNYLGRDERFVNLDNEDAFNHYLDGVIDMGGAGGRTDLKVGGLYTQTRESSGSEFDSNFNPRSKRFVKAGHADLLWRISQLFKATFNTRYEKETFDDASLSEEENAFVDVGGSLFWQYSTPMAFGMRYNFRHIDFMENFGDNSDSDTHSIFLATRWVPTSTLSTELALGFEDRAFDRFSNQDRTDFAFELEADYHPTDRSNFTLAGSRRIKNSTFRDVQSAEVTKFTLGWEQKLGIKLASIIEAGWEHVAYNERSEDTVAPGQPQRFRSDDNAIVDFALAYHIQPWLLAKTKYHYQFRESNFDDKDYTQHVISIGLSAVY